MRKRVTRTGLGLLGGILCGLTACTTAEPPSNPGALPTAKMSKVDPRLDASTYLAHAHLLERQGHYERAVSQYREALKINPNLVAARNRLGITLNKLGRHAEASAEFRAAMEIEPRAAHLYNNLGFSLYLDGHFEAAERTLARATELQPGFRRAHMNRGLVLSRLGRYDDALEAFCEAGPRDEAYYNLAVVQTESGRYIDATRALEQALAMNPDFAAARRQLREISRLAAAQEAEQAAFAAAVAEDGEHRCPAGLPSREQQDEVAAVGTAPTPPSADTPAAEDRGAHGGEIATSPSAPPVAPPQMAAAVWPRDPAANARAWRQLHYYLLAASEQVPPAPRPLPRIGCAELAALFDEFVAALWQDAPWQEDTLARLLHALILSAQRP